MKKISKSELSDILEKHELWLESDGEEGERADFRGADLTRTELSGSNLSGANLSGANLAGAKIRCSSFVGAELRGANFIYADLFSANFSFADFAGANLACTNLMGSKIEHAEGIINFGPIGEIRRICYAVDHGDKVMVKLGWFWGPSDEALAKVSDKYGASSAYFRMLEAAVDAFREGNK